MSAAVLSATAPARASSVDPLFLSPWNDLNDASLLAHYRSARAVFFEPVVDPEEIPPARIEGIMQGRFEFNGETHVLADPLNWLYNPSADIEWHILLHKFYYAAGLSQAWQASGDARYVQRWAQLIDGWIRVTPPDFIAADVTGRRVQNWIYSLHGLVMQGRADMTAPVDANFFRRMLHSLHEQVEFLCANLTPKRNHRTLELLAICLAGAVFPEFWRAAHWRAFALQETLVNIQADLLDDGVHCELSTDYHHLALRNWLQVRNLAANNGETVPAAMDEALERALEFSLHVHKPDGIVPSFSDGDARSYLPLLLQGAQLFGREDMRFVATQGRQGTPPIRRVAYFSASGYHVLRSGWPASPQFTDAQHLVFDCGPLGEGNHGHFDALSFELAANGRSLVVDPGRYTYSEAGDTNWRVQFRSTAAHNTVCVDGLPQTRYLPKPIKQPSRHSQGSVRHKIAGPAPETTLIECAANSMLDLLQGRCDSYAYDAVHQRCIVFVDCRYWIVSDWLRAKSFHDYTLNFQLSPDADQRTTLLRENGTQLISPGLSIAQPPRTGQLAALDDGWVSTRYGDKQPAPALRTTVHGRDEDFDTVLLPWTGSAPHLAVSDLPVFGRNEVEDEGKPTSRALRIDLTMNGKPVHDVWFHARGVQAQCWHIGPYQFFGRWLHWREAPDGSIVRAMSHSGATLNGPTGAIRLIEGSRA
jgi:Heparinase II/III-like protein/Heparinase II/III N-terminus